MGCYVVARGMAFVKAVINTLVPCKAGRFWNAEGPSASQQGLSAVVVKSLPLVPLGDSQKVHENAR
jgi:hypothetical protein